MVVPRDRLSELQQRTGMAMVPAAADATAATNSSSHTSRQTKSDTMVTVNRPGRLLRLIRRTAPAADPAPGISADALITAVAALSSDVTEVRSQVDEVSRQQCRQLNSPHHQYQAWQQTQQLSSAALSKLSKIKTELDQLQTQLKSRAGELTTTQRQMVQIQINSTRTQLLAVVEHFNNEEVNFRQRKRDHLKRQLMITGAAPSEDELENLLDQGDPQIFSESILLREETARAQLGEVEDRYEQIRSLETSIEQLREMFQQLSLLVHSQGEMVDRIETNILQSAASAEKGQKELGSAVQKRNKNRKRMMVCGGIVAVLLLVLLVILLSYLG